MLANKLAKCLARINDYLCAKIVAAQTIYKVFNNAKRTIMFAS